METCAWKLLLEAAAAVDADALAPVSSVAIPPLPSHRKLPNLKERKAVDNAVHELNQRLKSCGYNLTKSESAALDTRLESGHLAATFIIQGSRYHLH